MPSSTWHLGAARSTLPCPWRDKVEVLFSITCVGHPPRKHCLNELSFDRGSEPGRLLSGVLFAQIVLTRGGELAEAGAASQSFLILWAHDPSLKAKPRDYLALPPTPLHPR